MGTKVDVKAKELKMNIMMVRKRIDKYMKTHPQHRHLKTVILLGIMMKRYGFSPRGMIRELYYRSGSRRRPASSTFRQSHGCKSG